MCLMSLTKRILGLRELAIIAVLIIEVGVFAVLLHRPDRENPMLKPDVWLGVALDTTVLSIAAIGSCIVIVSGGIDLAVGSVIGLSCVLTAFVIHGLTPLVGAAVAVPLGILAGLGGGTLAGLTSGTFVTAVRLPPFVATLAMMSIARGLAFLVTRGSTIEVPESLFTRNFGRGVIPISFQWLYRWPAIERAIPDRIQVERVDVPAPVVLLVVLALAVTFFMTRMKWGRQIYAVGGNEQAARFAGVRVGRIKLLVYGLAGAMAGLAGVVLGAHYGTGQSTAAMGWELDAIAAVVVGGGSLSGGRGSVIGTCFAAIIFGMLQSGLTMLRMSDYKQLIVGLVIVSVVAFDLLTSAKGD